MRAHEHRMTALTSYIAMGSNLQQPLQQLRSATKGLAQLPDSTLISISQAYRSAAVGPGEQPDYLNAVARVDTRLPPRELLAGLQALERAHGRERSERWGARTLDLDILLYGDLYMDEPALTIPHPRMRERNFVLYPLAEVAQENLVLPDGTDLDTLLSNCPRGDLLETGLDLDSEEACTPKA